MLDLARYETIRPAPHAVFDRLEERRTRVRFMVPDGNDWRAVTWGGYAAKIRGIASFLAGAGMEPGERACIFAANSVEWMAAAMGIQSAQGVMVPIYPASTAQQAAYVARHCDASFVFVAGRELVGRVLAAWDDYRAVRRFIVMDDMSVVHAALKHLKDQGRATPGIDEIESRVLTFESALARGAERDEQHPDWFRASIDALTLDRNAFMLYTSGTTGNPKGVPLTHSNVGHNGLDWLRCFAPLLEEGYTDLLWLPMSHIFGFGEACVADSLGWTTYLADPSNALTRLPEVRPDVFFSVPAYWEKLAGAAMVETDAARQRARLAASTGGKLRFCLSGGAGLKREVKELFYRNGLLILEGYGLSECSPTLTLNRPDDFRFDSVGKALPSVELKLDEDGEILARGPNVFAGYHKEPDATRQCFTDHGWFRTGDVGRFTEDGFLQIVDRKKEILVTAGGKNVAPANIELRFADEPLVSHAVVYGDSKKYVVAGVWLDAEAVAQRLAREGIDNGGRPVAIQQWVASAIERVNQDLAKYEQIKRFRVMDVPLTVAGGHLTSTLKVRRKHVWKAFEREFESLYEESP
ncbi:MAG: AMP-binding protein [Polyangiaceae bacterium]|nr:AMP-binding protein [Polyangiaceae bacterium]